MELFSIESPLCIFCFVQEFLCHIIYSCLFQSSFIAWVYSSIWIEILNLLILLFRFSKIPIKIFILSCSITKVKKNFGIVAIWETFLFGQLIIVEVPIEVWNSFRWNITWFHAVLENNLSGGILIHFFIMDILCMISLSRDPHCIFSWWWDAEQVITFQCLIITHIFLFFI